MKVLRKWQRHSGRSRRRRGIDTTIHLSVHLSIHPSREISRQSIISYSLSRVFLSHSYLLALNFFLALAISILFSLYFLRLSFTSIFTLYLYSFLSLLLHHCLLYSMLFCTVVTLSHQVLVDHYHNDNDVEFVFKRTLSTVYTIVLYIPTDSLLKKLFPGH